MKSKLLIAILGVLIVVACNDNDTKTTTGGDDKKVIADSLYEEVNDGHNVGMARMVNIEKAHAEARRILDSINRLPAKAREASRPLKQRLDTLLKDLEYASMAMDKWMVEFKWDSAKNDLDKRINYLTEEKLKVSKVKEAILGTLNKADTIIKKNF